MITYADIVAQKNKKRAIANIAISAVMLAIDLPLFIVTITPILIHIATILANASLMHSKSKNFTKQRKQIEAAWTSLFIIAIVSIPIIPFALLFAHEALYSTPPQERSSSYLNLVILYLYLSVPLHTFEAFFIRYNTHKMQEIANDDYNSPPPDLSNGIFSPSDKKT